MKIRAVEATQAHINYLTGKLRASDHEECEAVDGKDADVSLQDGFNYSRKSWVLVDSEDKPFACFGVTGDFYEVGVGVPWLLGTDRIKEFSVGFLNISRPCIQQMLDEFEYLHNFIDARNITSIKWLQWCGFTMGEPEPFGVYGLPFRKFWLKRGDKGYV